MFDLHHCVVLDDGQSGTAQLLLHPSHLIVAHEPGEVPAAFAAMQAALAAGHHLAGYLTYALGFAPRAQLESPDASGPNVAAAVVRGVRYRAHPARFCSLRCPLAAGAGLRGAYCGAIGMFAPDGSASFNVPIRTITVHNGEAELGVGGAIVADSRVDDEYDECLLKTRFFQAARHSVSLLETLAYTGDTWPRRARHLRRLQDSAKALGIPSAQPMPTLHWTRQWHRAAPRHGECDSPCTKMVP